ncbi:hypothetical protein HUW83_06525 [Fusobacterium animalis]|uniref:hypothetical protein n=1 Tax=Fusobacterium animalis TaxID=76859 RepID=UPI0030CD00A3
MKKCVLYIKTNNKIKKFNLSDLFAEIPNTIEYASQRGIDIENKKKMLEFLYG